MDKRRALPGRKKNHVVNVRIDDVEYEQLSRYCTTVNSTKSEVFRLAFKILLTHFNGK